MTMNYQTAEVKLGKARKREAGKPLENNTRLLDRDGAIALKFHNTDIALFKRNGDVTIDTEGWHTVATKARLNEYVEGFQIWSENRILFFSYQGKSYLFKDGLTLHRNGTVTGAGDLEEAKEVKRMKKAVDRKVAQYIKGFIEDIKTNGLEDPSGGDCWLCMMETKQVDHILSHFEEKYYVPTLLWKAINSHRPEQSANFLWSYGKHNPDLFNLPLRSYLGKLKMSMVDGLI
jgi:hypothetical protein